MGRAIADYHKNKKASKLRVFSPLHIDADTLEQVAEDNSYMAEMITEGEHYDYLARITKRV